MFGVPSDELREACQKVLGATLKVEDSNIFDLLFFAWHCSIYKIILCTWLALIRIWSIPPFDITLAIVDDEVLVLVIFWLVLLLVLLLLWFTLLLLLWLWFIFNLRTAAGWRFPWALFAFIWRACSMSRCGTVHKRSHWDIIVSVNLQHCAAIRTCAAISFLSTGWTNLKDEPWIIKCDSLSLEKEVTRQARPLQKY